MAFCAPLAFGWRAGPELPFWCRGLPCSPWSFWALSWRVWEVCSFPVPSQGHAASYQNSDGQNTRPVSTGFSSERGGTQLARWGDLQGRLSLGAGGMVEQWVLPSGSAGSAGSAGSWRRRRSHFSWGKAGSHSRAGQRSLNCPQGSARVCSATGQAGSPLTTSLLAVYGHRRRVSSGTPCGISPTDG